MFLEDLGIVASLWASTLVIGLISWPTAAWLFVGAGDRGYAVSKLLGWLVVTYLLFLLATLRWVPLTLGGILSIVLLWALINLLVEWKKRPVREHLPNLKQLLLAEAGFFLLIAAWAFIKAHDPEVSVDTERFMDHGFVQALFNSVYLPLESIWFAGEPLNYYYFGHLWGYVVLTLSRVSPVPGFFALGAWQFGLLGLLIWRLGLDVFRLITPRIDSLSARIRPALLAGAISFFVVLFAGVWQTAWRFLLYLVDKGDLPRHYWDAVRIIPGTATEMPHYGLLASDLHSHVWGLLPGIAILTLLYSLWRSSDPLTIKNPRLWGLALVLAVAYMTNAWDALTLGGLSVVVIFFKYFSISNLLRLGGYSLGLAAAAYALALPWSLFYQPPVTGIGWVPDPSPIGAWFSVWGFFVAIIVLFLLGLARELKKQPPGQRSLLAARTLPLFLLPIILTVILFGAAMEIVYIKDILDEGEWYRFNTVFKVSSQLWLWLGVLSGPIIVWSITRFTSRWTKACLAGLFSLMLMAQGIYPVLAIWQSGLHSDYSGLATGLEWWQEQYPYDYEAYVFLNNYRQSLPQTERQHRLVEAVYDTYAPNGRFSVFLGWPTIIGWPNHEWTWRGSYKPVRERLEEVREIYTGRDKEHARKLLRKYRIDYIIVGQIEAETFGAELRSRKLRDLGKVIFENEETAIIKTSPLYQ